MVLGKLIALGAMTVGAFALVQIVNKKNPDLSKSIKNFTEVSKKAQKEVISKPEVIEASEELKNQLANTTDILIQDAKCLVCKYRSECNCVDYDDCKKMQEAMFEEMFEREEDYDEYDDDYDEDEDYYEEDEEDCELYDVEELEAMAEALNKEFNLEDNNELDVF